MSRDRQLDNLKGLEEARRSLKSCMRNLYAIKGRGRTDFDELLAEGEALVTALDDATAGLLQEDQADG